jgi:hypothetical protein
MVPFHADLDRNFEEVPFDVARWGASTPDKELEDHVFVRDFFQKSQLTYLLCNEGRVGSIEQHLPLQKTQDRNSRFFLKKIVAS